MTVSAPVVLIVSGLDPSGGAGFVLDLAVVRDLGAVGCGAVTALTVQDTSGARRCEPVDSVLLAEQIGAVLTDYEVAAVKIGLVPSAESARAIAEPLRLTHAPIVWDPVFSASAGSALLFDHPRAIADELAKECTLITPNQGEAAALDGDGAELNSRYGCHVLITGGHGDSAEAIDVLHSSADPRSYRAPRHEGPVPRGTGCFLSSAIAARLAHGRKVPDAIEQAKATLTARLDHVHARGRGAPVLW